MKIFLLACATMYLSGLCCLHKYFVITVIIVCIHVSWSSEYGTGLQSWKSSLWVQTLGVNRVFLMITVAMQCIRHHFDWNTVGVVIKHQFIHPAKCSLQITLFSIVHCATCFLIIPPCTCILSCKLHCASLCISLDWCCSWTRHDYRYGEHWRMFGWNLRIQWLHEYIRCHWLPHNDHRKRHGSCGSDHDTDLGVHLQSSKLYLPIGMHTRSLLQQRNVHQEQVECRRVGTSHIS